MTALVMTAKEWINHAKSLSKEDDVNSHYVKVLAMIAEKAIEQRDECIKEIPPQGKRGDRTCITLYNAELDAIAKGDG